MTDEIETVRVWSCARLCMLLLLLGKRPVWRSWLCNSSPGHSPGYRILFCIYFCVFLIMTPLTLFSQVEPFLEPVRPFSRTWSEKPRSYQPASKNNYNIVLHSRFAHDPQHHCRPVFPVLSPSSICDKLLSIPYMLSLMFYASSTACSLQCIGIRGFTNCSYCRGYDNAVDLQNTLPILWTRTCEIILRQTAF